MDIFLTKEMIDCNRHLFLICCLKAWCPEIIASDKISGVKMAADKMQSGQNSNRSK